MTVSPAPTTLRTTALDQACVIEITDEWIGYLDVHQFATEENFDFLYVNDCSVLGHYGKSLLSMECHSVRDDLLELADYIYNEAGFKICRTNVMRDGHDHNISKLPTSLTSRTMNSGA